VGSLFGIFIWFLNLFHPVRKGSNFYKLLPEGLFSGTEKHRFPEKIILRTGICEAFEKCSKSPFHKLRERPLPNFQI
jgi:hypothetical protein